MKLVGKKEEHKKVKVGDIIVTDNNSYLVVERSRGNSELVYELRNLEGFSTRNGEHTSIDEMLEDVVKRQGGYTHYPASEYELSITRKESF